MSFSNMAQHILRRCVRFGSQYCKYSKRVTILPVESTNIQNGYVYTSHHRLLHTNHRFLSSDLLSDKEKRLSVRQSDLFEEVATKKNVKNAETFRLAIHMFKERNPYHRRHVEFTYAALDKMKEFGVDKDLASYKQLIGTFPKEIYVAKTRIQAEFKHHPKQQDCMLQLLNNMSDKGVMPDTETGQMIIDVFGQGTHAFRMYQRMMYWMPKSLHANPYPVPSPMPTDPKEVAQAALVRMSVGEENEVTVFRPSSVEGHESSAEDTFVASAQSPDQRELVSQLSSTTAVVVEGPYRSYIGGQAQIYYTLRTDPTERYKRYQEAEKEQEEDDTKFEFTTMFEEEEYAERAVPPTKHEQHDGTILAMCIPGSGPHRPALLAWIKWLEGTNPRLAQVPVLFQIESEGVDGGQLEVYTGKPQKKETIEQKALKEMFKDEGKRTDGF